MTRISKIINEEVSHPFHRQHGVELGGPGVALGLVEMELREDIVSGTNFSFSFTVCLEDVIT